ncbi:MAG: hypothetical protein V1856_01985 [Candidatus Liptonbacteria bacterium]
MIELDSSNGASIKPDKVVDWSGNMFVFVDDSQVSREENTKRVIRALKKELGAVLIHTENPVFQNLMDKQERGDMLSAEERGLLDAFLHEASAGL